MGIRIAYNFDTWDDATISSSSEASADLADDNVVHDHVGKPWRSSTDSGEWIKFDLGAATQITVVGIFNHNLTAAATATLEANSSDSWGAPAYTQALTIATDSDGNPYPRIVLFLDKTYRWWRLTFTDAANPDTYIQIGRIVGAAYYEPARTMSEGWSLTSEDPSEGQNRPGTHTFWMQRNKYRKASVSFAYTSRTQRTKFQTIFDKIGLTNPLLLALQPGDYPTEDSMYCYLLTPLEMTNRLVEQYDIVNLVFEEKTE